MVVLCGDIRTTLGHAEIIGNEIPCVAVFKILNGYEQNLVVDFSGKKWWDGCMATRASEKYWAPGGGTTGGSCKFI